MIYLCMCVFLSCQIPEWFRFRYRSGRACWIYFWRGSEWDQKWKDQIHGQELVGVVWIFVRVWSSLSASWAASSLQRLPSILGLVELQAPLRTSPFSSLWMERKSRERDREKEGGGEGRRTFEGAGGIREICVCVCVCTYRKRKWQKRRGKWSEILFYWVSTRWELMLG